MDGITVTDAALAALEEYNAAYKAGGELEFPQWAADFLARPKPKPAPQPLSDAEAIRNAARNYARLRYLYDMQMRQLIMPCMTFGEWLNAIDADINGDQALQSFPAPAASEALTDQDERDRETGKKWREDSSLETWFPFSAGELAATKRLFHAACADLGAINEELGLDPDDGGAEPIISAIRELKAASSPAPKQDTGVAAEKVPDAEMVECYLWTLLKEAQRRGSMFPQSRDEQKKDSDAILLVAQMVRWYGERDEPTSASVLKLRTERARNRARSAQPEAGKEEAEGEQP